MPPTGVENPTEAQWAVHKDLLTELYQTDGKPLHEVMSIMENQHRFIAKKNQYEKYLRDKWRLRKKTKSSTWKAIAPAIHDLEQKRQKYNVWIDGQKIPLQTVRRETRRYLRSDDTVSSSTALSDLPAGVTVAPVQLLASPTIVSHDLPFFAFQQYLQGNLFLNPPRERYAAQNLLAKPLDIAALQQLEVATTLGKDLDPVSDDFQMISGFHGSLSWVGRSVLFSLANNFAGLDYSDAKAIVEAIRPDIFTFFRMLKGSPTDSFSLRAIAKSIYEISIRNGDAELVDLLLSQQLPDVTANMFLYDELGRKRTPIAIAAAAQHTDLVKVLLKYNADPNLTFQNYFGVETNDGALSCLMEGVRGLADDYLDTELVELLLNLSANFHIQSFKNILELNDYGRFICLVLSRNPASQWEMWSSEGIFREMFRYQKCEVLLQIVEILQESIGDLSKLDPVSSPAEEYYCHSGFIFGDVFGTKWLNSDFCTLADIAVFRGDLEIIETLLKGKSRMNGSALLLAIQNGSQTLIEMVLNQDLSTCHNEVFWDLAIAASIYSGDVQIINLIRSQCSKLTVCFDETLKAAARMGDWDLFRHLYRLIPEPVTEDKFSTKSENIRYCHTLRIAMAYAIKDGKDEIALELIDAGISTSQTDTGDELESLSKRSSTAFECLLQRGVWRNGTLESPLSEALMKGNTRIITALLNADAVKSSEESDQCKDTSLVHAIQWGDVDIVKAIIDAGRTPRSHSESEEIAAMIVKADTELFHVVQDLFPCEWTRALIVVIESGNLAMVERVLQQGANPGDAQALAQAYGHNLAIFDLLLAEHTSRHPRGCQKWGSDIIAASVDSNDMELFTKLLRAGADTNQIFGSEFQIKRLSKLLNRTTYERDWFPSLPELGPMCSSVSVFGYAIYLSSRVGIEFVDCLLQTETVNGCKPETIVSHLYLERTVICKTAFLAAIESRNIPVIKLLIRHKANVNYPAKLNIKRTPIQQAAQQGSLDIVELLHGHGADINGPAAQRGGATALQLAAIGGWIKIVYYLLENGADVHAPVSKVNGRTPLEGAAESGRLDTVDLLLKVYGGYEPKYAREFARAITFAERERHHHIADYLRERQTFEFFDFAALEY